MSGRRGSPDAGCCRRWPLAIRTETENRLLRNGNVHIHAPSVVYVSRYHAATLYASNLSTISSPRTGGLHSTISELCIGDHNAPFVRTHSRRFSSRCPRRSPSDSIRCRHPGRLQWREICAIRRDRSRQHGDDRNGSQGGETASHRDGDSHSGDLARNRALSHPLRRSRIHPPLRSRERGVASRRIDARLLLVALPRRERLRAQPAPARAAALYAHRARVFPVSGKRCHRSPDAGPLRHRAGHAAVAAAQSALSRPVGSAFGEYVPAHLAIDLLLQPPPATRYVHGRAHPAPLHLHGALSR